MVTQEIAIIKVVITTVYLRLSPIQPKINAPIGLNKYVEQIIFSSIKISRLFKKFINNIIDLMLDLTQEEIEFFIKIFNEYYYIVLDVLVIASVSVVISRNLVGMLNEIATVTDASSQ